MVGASAGQRFNMGSYDRYCHQMATPPCGTPAARLFQMVGQQALLATQRCCRHLLAPVYTTKRNSKVGIFGYREGKSGFSQEQRGWMDCGTAALFSKCVAP
jgi:hypothetical protein